MNSKQVMKTMHAIIVLLVLFGVIACGVADEKVPVDTDIVDTGNIQDGTVIEKAIDTPDLKNDKLK